MAFLAKNYANPSTRYANGDAPVLEQWVRVSRATDTLPQTATETLFTVSGGRVLVKAMIGEVTTVIQTQANSTSVVHNSDANANDATLASGLDITGDVVGQLYTVEGDGTALVDGAGAVQAALGGGFILNPGAIRLTCAASNTGSVKWDLYYMPLDPTAYVVPSAV